MCTMPMMQCCAFRKNGMRMGIWRDFYQRLNKFGLAVHSEKTRLIRFGCYATEQSVRRKEGKPESFDVLGFTHYCTTRRNGEFKVVGRKTIRKRLVSQISAVQRELRRRMHEPVGLTLKWLRSVLIGYMNYYSASGNGRSVSLLHYEIVNRWFKILRRRSQHFTLIWERFSPWVSRQYALCILIQKCDLALGNRSRSRMR